MGGGAEAGDADTLAFELLDGFESRSSYDSIVEIVLNTGDITGSRPEGVPAP